MKRSQLWPSNRIAVPGLSAGMRQSDNKQSSFIISVVETAKINKHILSKVEEIRMSKRQKTGGREIGTPNKTTASVKEALLSAFEAIGGDEAFREWAVENKSEYYRLFAKLLPMQVKSEAQITQTVVNRLITPSDKEIIARYETGRRDQVLLNESR